ncbi:nucleoside deaminase [Aureispira anguillae]|uniref:tRNA-specific adenosine deaminase n=1 Tax=Aureispira anguillae TaxID=2864201 RepID=A0A915YL69_9BACT|nr:nucleoside deaminase [Aureispira anguillae]BDS15257.1 nucleoside deaminase [Aureispira anguillae]
MFSVFSHEYYMKEALKEAEKAALVDEIPVGAIVVCRQQIIARAHNWTEHLTDVTAHAEILAITAASKYLNNKYLQKCTLYVTLEPCVMCSGALAWAQLGELVIGATDAKRGYSQLAPQALHPKTKIITGVLAEECGQLLSSFFQKKRS